MSRTRAWVLTIVAWLPALPAAQGTSAAQQGRSLAIVDVSVLDVRNGSLQVGRSVLVSGDRIEVVGGHGLSIPEGAELVDGKGRYLIPALYDMHTHLANRPEPRLAEDVLLPLFLAHGVLTVRDMGSDWSRIVALRQGIAEGRLRGPRILSPGPFVDGPQEPGPLFLPVATAAEARLAVRELVSKGVDFVKVQAGLTPETYAAVADEAQRHGLAFAGHVPEAVSAFEVVRSGQISIEHVSPALPGDAGLLLACSAREDELRRELLEISRLAKEPAARADELPARMRALQEALIAAASRPKTLALLNALRISGVRVVPTLVWSETQLPEGRDQRLDDVPLQHAPAALRAEWLSRRRAYLEQASAETFARHQRITLRSRAFVSEIQRGGVKLLAGTDSFDAFVLPGESLHRELELLAAAGLTPLEALRAATWDPAELLGESAQRGSVEPGKLADLILLDADPSLDIRATRRIHAVVQAGRLWRRPQLDAVLAAVETAAAGR